MLLQRCLCLLFIGWLSVSAGAFDARRSTAQRVRTARCPRLELDHHSDQSHEGESHSLNAHYGHHQMLEARTGAFARIALASGDAMSAATVAAVSVRLLVAPPGPAFQAAPTPAPPSAAAFRAPRHTRGRAPPAFSV